MTKLVNKLGERGLNQEQKDLRNKLLKEVDKELKPVYIGAAILALIVIINFLMILPRLLEQQ